MSRYQQRRHPFHSYERQTVSISTWDRRFVLCCVAVILVTIPPGHVMAQDPNGAGLAGSEGTVCLQILRRPPQTRSVQCRSSPQEK